MENVLIVGRQFSDFNELQNAIRQLEAETHAKFVIGSSRKAESRNKTLSTKNIAYHPKFVYTSVSFACKHYGQARKRPGLGVRPNQRSFKLDCPARVLAYADRHKDCFVISKSCLTHNHDVSADAYNQYPESRRLSQTEKEKAEELLRLNLSPAKVKDYLNSLTGKCITAKDIYNLKLKLSSVDTKKDSSLSISHPDVVRRVIKDEDFACDAYEDKSDCTVPDENRWSPALPGVNSVDAINFGKCNQQIDKPAFKTQASQTEVPCKCRGAVSSKTMTSNTSKMEKPLSLIWGCELNDKNKTATFVSDDTKYQHQLALRTICLGAEAKDEFNVVEIVPGEGEGADAKPVPLATLKSSVMPTVTISGIELPPQVTFRLKAGSGPVYISAQHILEEDLSFDEEDGEEEEDEEVDEEIEESPPKPVKRAASNKKSAPTKRKNTDEEEDEEEELASEEESPPKKGKGRGRKPAAKK
ncbi:uncharacterized protein LOC121302297 [Polyodon spathula]|uniref:uncharacterized protein LOC121302297 n=1 Tax=Polyodon spathula TaxID=7913 RepID=UPI001B7EF725|nr:uncharacterized protein LOC121302297 [Polyodon spathula]XP_041088090.1 uncharacterized protein LOC121302297 [Polyodon spathula]